MILIWAATWDFQKMWYVRPAKAQTRLRIRAVWSEPLIVAWIFYACKATDWTPFRISKLKRRLHRLVWVYTCQNATFLVITCRGPYCYFGKCCRFHCLWNGCMFRWGCLVFFLVWQSTSRGRESRLVFLSHSSSYMFVSMLTCVRLYFLLVPQSDLWLVPLIQFIKAEWNCLHLSVGLAISNFRGTRFFPQILIRFFCRQTAKIQIRHLI